MQAPLRFDSKWSVPNLLTILRIFLVPFFIIMVIEKRFAPALSALTIAGISDALDGFIARYFNQRTELGSYLDPIADKLLMLSSYVCLGYTGVLPDWLCVIVISRDVLLVLGIGICSVASIKVEINPSKISKINTVAQISTIFFILLTKVITWNINPIIYSLFFYTTAGLTILSACQYAYRGLNVIGPGK